MNIDEPTLDALNEMVNSEGWRIFNKLLEEEENTLDSVDGLSSEKQMFVRQGMLMKIRDFVNLPDYIKNAYAALEDNDEAA
jgi:hypothetical protein